MYKEHGRRVPKDSLTDHGSVTGSSYNQKQTIACSANPMSHWAYVER
jgi:hypothetical protein